MGRSLLLLMHRVRLKACIMAIFYDRYGESVMQEILTIAVRWWKEGIILSVVTGRYYSSVDGVETTDTEIRDHGLLCNECNGGLTVHGEVPDCL